jgi:hypothetical protein
MVAIIDLGVLRTNDQPGIRTGIDLIAAAETGRDADAGTPAGILVQSKGQAERIVQSDFRATPG